MQYVGQNRQTTHQSSLGVLTLSQTSSPAWPVGPHQGIEHLAGFMHGIMRECFTTKAVLRSNHDILAKFQLLLWQAH